MYEAKAPTRFIRVEQAAEILGYHPEVVRRKARAGQIPAHKLPGGRDWFFDPKELTAFIRGKVS